MSVRLSPPWFETRSISAFPTQFRSGINPWVERCGTNPDLLLSLFYCN
jgi:hypothetical protein